FSWAIFGLHRLLDQKGFTDCPETRDIVMDYRRINNPVLCFVEDECMVGESYEISKETLFSSYKEYCKASGYSSMHKENFFRELYVAVHNIKQYRPRMGAERPYIMKGITVGTGGSAANTGS
ncbi:MAG: primase-like DNA-binding domain-containing protein, partial [Deltaproteobacteria bacterium]|nr:primase-like DNA-binding domain-containing protein [Deltaproteobacteria bacterium]